MFRYAVLLSLLASSAGFAATDFNAPAREPIAPYKIWKDVPDSDLKAFKAAAALAS